MNPKKMESINQEVDRVRVRNHFRNVCFRKKFPTIKDHIKYIAKYYGVDEKTILSSIESDLSIIKKQTGLN